MKFCIICCIFLFFFHIPDHGKIINNSQLSNYLVGEGYAENTGSPTDMENAKQRAMADLANQIQTSIVSETIHQVTETSNSLEEFTSSKVNLVSKLEILGISWDIKEDEKFIKVRALLEKETGQEIYKSRINEHVTKINLSKIRADESFSSRDSERSLAEFTTISRLYNIFEQDLLIYFILGGNKSELLIPEVSRAEVEDKIIRLTNKETNNFDDVINSLCSRIAPQLDPKNELILSPLNYQDTDWGSEFANYTILKVKNKLPEFFQNKEIFLQKEIIQEEGKKGADILTGSYWLKGENLEIIIDLFNEKGYSTGGTKIEFPQSFLESLNISTTPQNFVDAMSDRKYFGKDEIIYGDLKLDFWTNKGNSNLIFSENDIMRLYVRVNTPAYLRFIYHLANGMRTPLYENYFIDESKVNKTVELPTEFVCSAPFGVEKLQIFASTVVFPDLQTKNIFLEGQEYSVLVEDLPDFLNSTRGFLKKKDAEMKSAERIITITTVQ